MGLCACWVHPCFHALCCSVGSLGVEKGGSSSVLSCKCHPFTTKVKSVPPDLCPSSLLFPSDYSC